MSKPFTDADFIRQVTEDRNWRIREISDLKVAAKRADTGLQRVLLRALVAICYAHWEGHVKLAARKYMEHVALRKFQYKALDRQFLKNYFLPRLGAISSSKINVEDRCVLLDEILNASEKRFSKVNDDLINTKSNLNSEVLQEICLVVGIEFIGFVERTSFIDIFLLKRRNEVAHGEEVFVSIADLDELASNTIALMRMFSDALENHVVQQTYKLRA
ncbi:hypothetical protein SLNSH_21870 [Alsobacter soli]|uniref:RiboL-PSP-HEPN domain-containing protein n=1 Tax=Alsobacter soli TaxID=2109933 RepID=A0A2T1HMI8_9HYPH|nr:MAE_28990/MAE_18760 family HEPN-like nuclease [Alsobacter soli]PSC02848.1 hypothetical protein SLNSH_21870 [Alsobacter soli]